MPVDFRSYIALEEGLANRLTREWAIQSAPLYHQITEATRRGDYDQARQLISTINLRKVGEENREWIKFMLLSCALYGAGMANRKGPTFLSAGSYQNTLDTVVDSMLVGMETLGTQQAQQAALQLVARAQARAHPLFKVTKFNENHDEQGRFASADVETLLKKPDSDFKDQNPEEPAFQNKWLKSAWLSESDNPERKEALFDYMELGYTNVNQYLKGKEDLPPAVETVVKKQIGLLDELTTAPNNKLEQDTTLYRGVRASTISKILTAVGVDVAKENVGPVGLGIIKNHWDKTDLKSAIGLAFTDKAFASTSLAKNVADRFVKGGMLKIQAPAGTHGFYAGAYEDTEREFILPRGTSFVIKDVELVPKVGPVFTVRPIQEKDTTTKFNPYHDEQGRFSSSDTEANDNNEQLKWMTYQAHEAGHDSVDEMVEKDPTLFLRLAQEWRDKHVVKADIGQADLAIAGHVNPLQAVGQPIGFAAMLGARRKKKPVKKEDLPDRFYVDPDLLTFKSPAKSNTKKADVDGRYLTDFVSFAEGGASSLQMASSLNSSRVATWGFVGESEMMGKLKYKLSAVLDNRTSKFCEFINGHEFEIEDAKELVNRALQAQDPAELRTIQAWPDQSKAGMAEIEGMSTEELVAAGLHIPPYHPYCRTICVDVESNDDADTPRLTKPTSEEEEGGEDQEDLDAAEGEEGAEAAALEDSLEGSYEATMDDFENLGVDIDEADLDHWNEFIGVDPKLMFAAFLDESPDDILPGDYTGFQISVADDGSVDIDFEDQFDGGKVDVDTTYDPYDGSYYLDQADFVSGDVDAAGDYLSHIFDTMIEQGDDFGASSVIASSGGSTADYVRLGFLPEQDDWNDLRQSALDAIASGEGDLADAVNGLTEDDQSYVNDLLSDDDPASYRALVDTDSLQSIADLVAGDSDLSMTLDLTDSDAVDRAQWFLESGYGEP